MIRTRFAPLALAIFALAACNKSDDSSTAKPAGTVKAVAAPAGTTWAEKVEVTGEGIKVGNPNAEIQIIEYGSYTCSHCRDFQAEAHDTIERDYVNTGKISFEYRHMIRDPLDLTAALVAHCFDPAAFSAINTQLFANQSAMISAITAHSQAEQQAAGQAPPNERFVKLAELSGLIEFAKQRGLAEDKLRTCLADNKKAETIAAQSQAVLEKYPDFPGTPSFLLNGTLLDATASWDKLRERLRDAGA